MATDGSQYYGEIANLFDIGDDNDYENMAGIFPQFIPPLGEASAAKGWEAMDQSTRVQPRPPTLRTNPTSGKRKSGTYHSIEDQRELTKKTQRIVDDAGQVDFYYFGQYASAYRFADRCHIYHRSDPESINGEILPRLESFEKKSDVKTMREARKLFDSKNIKGGLLLEYAKGNIWATRHCLVHIFFSNFFTGAKCIKLDRNVRTKIFSQDEFDEVYEEFKKGSSKRPSNEVYLGFGRQWYFLKSDDMTSPLPVAAIVKSRRRQGDVESADLEPQMKSLLISGQGR